MAGSLLVTPQSPWAASLLAAVPAIAQLSDADAIALEQASRERQSGSNGLIATLWLWPDVWSSIQRSSRCCIPKTAPTSRL